MYIAGYIHIEGHTYRRAYNWRYSCIYMKRHAQYTKDIASNIAVLICIPSRTWRRRA
jgi:hypothetical protein